MRRRMHRLLAPTLTLALLAALACVAPAPAVAADGITRGTVYSDGPDNRYLLGGDWLFRLDNDQGTAQRFQRQTTTDGWTDDDRAQRVERGRQLRRLDDGHRRLVSQGLSPARRALADGLARALRVGQLPRAGLAQRPADRPQHRRLPAVGPASAAQRAQAPGDQPARRARRQPPPADRLPAVGPDRLGRSGGRLVELRRPAARGLPAARGPRRHHEPRRAPRTAVRDVRRERARARRRAQLRRQHDERARHRPLRRACDQPRHAPRRRAGPSRASRRASASPGRGCGHRRARTSTTRASPSARATGGCSATRSRAASARSRSPAAS